MKKVLLSLLLLSALFTNAQVGFGPADKSSYILAQPTAQSLAATGSIQWTVKPGATYLLTISNAPAATTAFAATVTFEVSTDNTNWTAVTGNPRIGLPGAGLAAASTTTAAGLWEIYATGFTNYIRARVSAYTSGTVWAYLDALGIDNEIIMMPFTPSVTLGANLTGWINTSGLSEIGIHVSAVTTTVVTAQGTDDPTGTVVQSIPLVNDNSANQAAATTFAAAGTFIIPNPNHKWVRFQVTTTGTVLTIQGVAARFGQSVKLSNSQGGIGLNGASVTIGSGTITTLSNTTALTPGTAATNLGKSRNLAIGATDVGVGDLWLRSDALTTFGTSGNYTTPIADKYGAAIVKDEQRHKRTYVSTASSYATVASAADILQIIGSATTTVTITKIIISGTQTTGGLINFVFDKRSSANTGGTPNALVAFPYDATDAAATAALSTYTVNPTAGSLVGTVRSLNIPIPATTATTIPIVEVNFGERGKGVVLNGVAQALVIRLGGVTITGGSLNITVEWTEE